MIVRPSRDDDWPAILDVHRRAFGGEAEPRMADEVRASAGRVPPQALYDWAFQVAVLDEDAQLPQGRVVYPPTFPG